MGWQEASKQKYCGNCLLWKKNKKCEIDGYVKQPYYKCHSTNYYIDKRK